MRLPGIRLLVALCGVALGLWGCVTLKRTPEARFFYLRALAPPGGGAAALEGTPLLAVMTARLPGPLERPQLVTEVAPGELRVDEFLRWAEPLEAGVTRALAENLANLLPHYRVVRFPWRARVEPRWRLMVELSDFGLHGRSEVRLVGRWALLPLGREGARFARPVDLRRTTSLTGDPGVDAGASVEVMSALLAQLSAEIATAVHGLARAPAAGGEPGTDTPEQDPSPVGY